MKETLSKNKEMQTYKTYNNGKWEHIGRERDNRQQVHGWSYKTKQKTEGTDGI